MSVGYKNEQMFGIKKNLYLDSRTIPIPSRTLIMTEEDEDQENQHGS